MEGAFVVGFLVAGALVGGGAAVVATGNDKSRSENCIGSYLTSQ